MREAVVFGELSVKMEKYRYNLISSLSWVIFGMLISGAVLLYDGISMLTGPNSLYIAVIVVLAGIAVVIYRSMWGLAPKDEKMKKAWRTGQLLMVLPFLLSYSVIPKFLNLTPLQQSLYYSTVWYPSLGVGLIFLGVFAELRDQLLITKAITLSGIAITASSVVLIPLSGLVTNYRDVMAVNLIMCSMMVFVYFASFVVSFFRSARAFLS